MIIDYTNHVTTCASMSQAMIYMSRVLEQFESKTCLRKKDNNKVSSNDKSTYIT